MYSIGWLTLVIISLAISLAAFIWALRNGQFADQARVRYFPLRDGKDGSESVGNPAKTPGPIYVLAALVGCGVLIMLAPVLLTLLN